MRIRDLLPKDATFGAGSAIRNLQDTYFYQFRPHQIDVNLVLSARLMLPRFDLAEPSVWRNMKTINHFGCMQMKFDGLGL